MNHDQYNLKTQAVFESLRKRYRKTRIIWSSQTINRVSQWGAISLYVGVMALIYFLFVHGTYDLQSMSPSNSTFFIYIFSVGMFGGVIAAGFTSGYTDPGMLMMHTLLSVFGIHGSLDKAQADLLATCARTYPDIHAMCVEWGTQNIGHVLTTRDYLAVYSASIKLKNYEQAHQMWIKEQHDLAHVDASLRACGVMGEIEARVDQQHLKQNTVKPKGDKAPPRF